MNFTNEFLENICLKNLSISNILESFFFFRATPVAYEGSQARGQIGAVAATATATLDLSRVCDLHHSS